MNQQLVRFDPQLLNRALIGFDHMFDLLERRYVNQTNNNYPPFNVIKCSENDYEIQVAVSGFNKEEITVEVDQDQLIIRGQRDREDDAHYEYLHRGLATRDFEKSLTLAEHMEVVNANIKNGILTVNIRRVVPEALKPRKITIQGE